MKRYFTILFLLVFASHLFGQVDTTRIFYAPKLQSNAFAELGSNFIQYHSGSALNVDFSINWLVNHKYYIGGVFQQLASVEEVGYTDTLNITQIGIVKQQSAGVRFGYILFHQSKIASFSPDISGGWSGIKLDGQKGKDLQHFGFINPALKGVFNVSNYFRVGVSINYRAYIGLDSYGITSKQLNGLGGGVFLRFGTF